VKGAPQEAYAAPEAEALEALEAETRRELAEVEALDEAARIEIGWLIGFAAWTIRQAVAPLPMESEGNWPIAPDVEGHPVLSWLATRDPAVNELARHQVRAMLNDDLDDEEADLGYLMIPKETAGLAARLLAHPTPSRRGRYGDHLARNVMLVRLRDILMEFNPWGVPLVKAPKRPFTDDGTGEALAWLDANPALSRLADHLADELERHFFLAEFPDAAPSPDAIRSVWLQWHAPDVVSSLWN
jgi:hypothetical protein